MLSSGQALNPTTGVRVGRSCEGTGAGRRRVTAEPGDAAARPGARDREQPQSGKGVEGAPRSPWRERGLPTPRFRRPPPECGGTTPGVKAAESVVIVTSPRNLCEPLRFPPTPGPTMRAKVSLRSLSAVLVRWPVMTFVVFYH